MVAASSEQLPAIFSVYYEVLCLFNTKDRVPIQAKRETQKSEAQNSHNVTVSVTQRNPVSKSSNKKRQTTWYLPVSCLSSAANGSSIDTNVIRLEEMVSSITLCPMYEVLGRRDLLDQELKTKLFHFDGYSLEN